MRLRSIPVFTLALLASAILSARAVADTSAAGKLGIPDAAALKSAAKLVDDIYKDDLAGAKTPAQKLTVAQKMLDASKDEKDPATLFTVLTKTVNLACEAADLQSAIAVIDRLDADFNIDALKLKFDSAASIGKISTTPDQCKTFIPLAATLVDSALFADRYDLAKSISAAIADAARTTKDPQLQAAAGTRLQQVAAQQSYEDTKSARQTLAANPNDPAANLKVGSFLCLVKGDWESGLPMLALSSDESFKSLAKTETAGVTTPGDQIKLADGWWDLAEKATGSAKSHMQSHAAQWYQVALPNLTGLAKARTEKRLASGDLVPHVSVNVGQRTVNLLALVDTTLDAVAGKWTLKDGALQSDQGGSSRLQLAFHPPAEYDFHVELSRVQGNDSVVMVLAAGGRQFLWLMGGWGNTITGFDMVAGEGASKNPTTIHSKSALENGKKYDVVVKVRKAGIEAFVNGKSVSKWATDYSDLGMAPGCEIRDKDALGLYTDHSSAKFYKVEVKEITGTGEVTRNHE